MPLGQMISEKAARRFALFSRENSFLFGRTQILLDYCQTDKDEQDIFVRNSVSIAHFEVSPQSLQRIKERSLHLKGLEPRERGVIQLYNPFEKPTQHEIDRAELALKAFIYGAKCRELGAKK